MATYTATGLGGWMMVFDATNLREAQRNARASAASASLLPGDIEDVRPATDDEVAWYAGMAGA